MGSKYFGRAIKKWRLYAGISQEDLARRAQVSVTLVGTIERERGHLSEEIFCKLCLGLESKLGKPLLRPVFADGIASLWQELSETQRHLRQARGLEAEEHEPEIRQGNVEETIDSAFAAVKTLVLHLSRSLESRSQALDWLPTHPSDTEEPRDNVRVRNPGRRPKSPRGSPAP